MKRAPELRALSAEHHQGLVLAKKAQRAAAGTGGPPVPQVWREVEARFAAELEPHFEIEEQTLAPPLREAGAAELVARLHADHQALRASVRPGAARTGAALARFGELLEQHIRFEERELFAAVQERLGAQALHAVEAACRRRT